jgi:hypothetical protein
MMSDGGKAQAKAEQDHLQRQWLDPLPPVTRCKHGPGDCERCGTSDRRDVRHSTVKGRGAVGILRGARR